PGRSALTAAGTLLGVGALVAVLGLTATATGQISERFTVLAATEVVVEQNADAATRHNGGAPYMAFPEDADARVGALNGVRNAGVWWDIEVEQAGVSRLPPGSAMEDAIDNITVMAVSPGALRAMNPEFSVGRGYDEFHDSRQENVALLGSAAAHQLGITRIDSFPAIFIDGQPFTVIGILSDVERNTGALLNVVIPRRTAEHWWGSPGAPARMLIETDIGAAQIVGAQAALALRPDDPEAFTVLTPPDPQSLKDTVTSDLNVLFILLAGVCLLIGTVGIANTTLVSVLERVPEIGLRRSVGARPRHIAGQFLAESASLGLIGGLAGTAVGIVVTVGVAIARDWTPIMPAWLPLSAPFLGMLTGLVAGLYPARRATRIEPAEALRR
ncbi:MAG: ABC transporter permease, partial [Jiangellaceae bacterium]